MVQNLLGEEITIGENRGTFDDEGVLTDLDPAFPGASLREAERKRFGLDFGYWMNKGVPGHQVRAIVDVMISRGYLKILLNPQLETVNGQTATVTIRDYTPIEEVRTSSAGSASVYNITKYVWVEDTLTVLPHVYSDGSIGLKTDIRIGSRSKPEGVVQRSIITERSINVEENRIQPGLSMIIGGMRKSEKRSVVRGVPFLKDLPIIGILFSSKDFEEKGTEIVFILTPSISSGSVPNSKIVSDLRQKHADPEYKTGLSLSQPWGSSTYTDALEKEATEAELKRVEAEIALEQARHAAQSEEERADLAQAETEKLRLRSAELLKHAEQLNAEAAKLTGRIEQTRKQDRANQQEIQELESQKEDLLRNAEQSLDAAKKASDEAQRLQQEAEQSTGAADAASLP
jgi:Flp pilus assembly secretin CpaC